MFKKNKWTQIGVLIGNECDCDSFIHVQEQKGSPTTLLMNRGVSELLIRKCHQKPYSVDCVGE